MSGFPSKPQAGEDVGGAWRLRVEGDGVGVAEQMMDRVRRRSSVVARWELGRCNIVGWI